MNNTPQRIIDASKDYLEKLRISSASIDPRRDRDRNLGFIAGAMFVLNDWVKVEDGLPFVKEGEDNSENVFAIVNDRIHIMAWCYIDEGFDDESGKDLSGWVWCTCNDDIYGDPEFDDNYEVTHWRYLPKSPK